MDHRFEYSYMFSIAQYCVTWCKMHLIVQCLRQYLIAQYLRGGDEANGGHLDWVMGSHAEGVRVCLFVCLFVCKQTAAILEPFIGFPFSKLNKCLLS